MTITLDPVDYWRMRALAADVHRLQLEARATVQLAQQKQQAALAALAARYDFDAGAVGPLALDDEALTLTVADRPAPVEAR